MQSQREDMREILEKQLSLNLQKRILDLNTLMQVKKLTK